VHALLIVLRWLAKLLVREHHPLRMKLVYAPVRATRRRDLHRCTAALSVHDGWMRVRPVRETPAGRIGRLSSAIRAAILEAAILEATSLEAAVRKDVAVRPCPPGRSNILRGSSTPIGENPVGENPVGGNPVGGDPPGGDTDPPKSALSSRR